MWDSVESEVASQVWMRFAQIEKAYDDESSVNQHSLEFFRDMQKAYSSLSGNQEYINRRSGEAYVLKWHPQRTDNLLRILPDVFKQTDLKSPRILDIGSGTGCLHTACSILMTDGRISSANLSLVEPLPTMRIMTRLTAKAIEAAQSITKRANWSFCEASSLQELIMCPDAITPSDLVLFHHTFPVYDPVKLDRVVRQVAAVGRALKQGGSILFIAPCNNTDKMKQVERMEEALQSNSFDLVWSQRRSERITSRYTKNAQPEATIAVMKKLAAEADERMLLPIADMDDKQSLPWYGSYYSVRLLTKRN